MEEKKCKYCAMMIPKEASICPHCRKPQGWTRSAKAFMGFLIFLVIAYAIGSIGNKQGTYPPTRSVHIGEEGILNSGGELVPVAIDQAAFDEFTKARVANDQEGMVQMIAQGYIFSVDKNTKVRVIDSQMFIRKIRILEGNFQGKAGWVASEYIK
jgi:hypothetical protein